MKGTKMRCYKV